MQNAYLEHAESSVAESHEFLTATGCWMLRAIAFEISPIKYSFSVAVSEANEDHLLICKHEKTEHSRVFKSTGG